MKNFVIDVDGVMTDGQYYYTSDGKFMKAFGPDDHDALLLLKPYISIQFVTGDKKGFAISKKRIVDDMKMPLESVSTFDRVAWMQTQGLDLQQTIYMGDGIFDAMVFDAVGYGIAPANAFPTTREKARFVTTCTGGRSAVAEACIHILETFFTPFNPLNARITHGGDWATHHP